MVPWTSIMVPLMEDHGVGGFGSGGAWGPPLAHGLYHIQSAVYSNVRMSCKRSPTNIDVIWVKYAHDSTKPQWAIQRQFNRIGATDGVGFHLESNGSLVLYNVQLTDAGEYRCYRIHRGKRINLGATILAVHGENPFLEYFPVQRDP